jgi:hypothetical protein
MEKYENVLIALFFVVLATGLVGPIGWIWRLAQWLA